MCSSDLATNKGYKVLVIDKRDNVGGNIYTEKIEGINVHKYGAHIFHTNIKEVWDYLNQYAIFNRFTNSPVANYKGELYSLPFNMYTFNKMWGVVTPKEAAEKIEEQRKEIITELKLKLGSDVSAWDVSDLITVQSTLKKYQAEKAKKEKLQSTQNHVKGMSEDALKDKVSAFLNAHPEFCDDFNG